MMVEDGSGVDDLMPLEAFSEGSSSSCPTTGLGGTIASSVKQWV